MHRLTEKSACALLFIAYFSASCSNKGRPTTGDLSWRKVGGRPGEDFCFILLRVVSLLLISSYHRRLVETSTVEGKEKHSRLKGVLVRRRWSPAPPTSRELQKTMNKCFWHQRNRGVLCGSVLLVPPVPRGLTGLTAPHTYLGELGDLSTFSTVH